MWFSNCTDGDPTCLKRIAMEMFLVGKVKWRRPGVVQRWRMRCSKASWWRHGCNVNCPNKFLKEMCLVRMARWWGFDPVQRSSDAWWLCFNSVLIKILTVSISYWSRFGQYPSRSERDLNCFEDLSMEIVLGSMVNKKNNKTRTKQKHNTNSN